MPVSLLSVRFFIYSTSRRPPTRTLLAIALLFVTTVLQAMPTGPGAGSSSRSALAASVVPDESAGAAQTPATAGPASSSGSTPPAADSAAGSAAKVPQDPEQSYTVGFSELSSDTLPPQYAYLTASIPELIKNNLETAPSHTYSANELRDYSQSLIQSALLAEGKKLSSLYDSRDAVIFPASTAASTGIATTGGATPDQRRAAIEVQIESERQQIEKLKQLSPSDIQVTNPKPISFWNGPNGEALLPAPGTDPHDLCAKQGLDFLIYGHITYSDQYAYLDLYGYDDALRITTFSKSYAARPEELYQTMAFATSEVTEPVLGRDSGSVTVAANPQSALVSVDGTIAGFGTVTTRFLTPGVHSVTVADSGYLANTFPITVTRSETAVVAVQLSPFQRGTVTIHSTPDGANVYIGSEWQGVTPLTLPLPETSRELRIAAKGYLDSHLLVTPGGPTDVSRVLESDTVDWGKIVGQRQERFYGNLGWFALSVPIPLMLNGIFQNQLIVAQEPGFATLSASDRQRIYVDANLSYYGTWITAVISGGLLVNAVISLVQYINAAQEFHVR